MASCVGIGGVWPLALVDGKPLTWFRVREDLSSGHEDPLSSKGGIVVSGKSLHLAF